MMNTAQKKLSREELMTRVAMNANLIHEKLTYAEFQKTILDFQLSEHEKFLYDFTQLFKQVDTDRNGIINEDEFRDLLSQMRVLHKDEDLIVLLQIVDPYNNQKMTYSEIVHLLSSHMISAYDDE
jgi:Ca2+-binding EF-hand superfamily protein